MPHHDTRRDQMPHGHGGRFRPADLEDRIAAKAREVAAVLWPKRRRGGGRHGRQAKA